MLQDLKYGLRAFRRTPVFSAIAVLTLALGIGANTAIFSLLDAVLLRALPVARPGELVLLSDPLSHGTAVGSERGTRSLFAFTEFEMLRDRNDVFVGMFAASSGSDRVPGSVEGEESSEPEQVSVKLTTGDYFNILGVNAARGTTFGPETDALRGGAPVAVASQAFWQRRLGARDAAVGTTVRLNETPFQIIGIMPEGFFGESVGVVPDLWVPMSMQAAIHPGRDYLSPSGRVLEKTMWLHVVGRLRPEVTMEQAQANIDLLFGQMLEAEAGVPMAERDRQALLDQQIELSAGGRGTSVLEAEFSAPLQALMALVAVVLLITCANVANLLLVRARGRERETAVRLALGAGRWRLLRQSMIESLLLATLGGSAALLLAVWTQSLLMYTVFEGALQGLRVELDWRMLAFNGAASIAAGCLAGIVPAIRSTRATLGAGLATAARLTPARGGRWAPAKLLVASQVALSLALLVTAGLFVRSFQNLTGASLGYERSGLLSFQIDPLAVGYRSTEVPGLYEEMHRRLERIPGISRVALSDNGLFNNSDSADPLRIEGYEPPDGERVSARYDQVGPGYFSTVGIPLLAGRPIEARDSRDSPRVGLINQTMADRFFSGTNPIGKRIDNIHPANPGSLEIVGVVADSKHNSVRERPVPRFYAPWANPFYPTTAVVFFLRAEGSDAGALIGSVRRELAAIDPALSRVGVRTLDERVGDTLADERMIVRLSSSFGLLALLLAAIGLYGVLAHDVMRRSGEIGVRMALGARRGSVSAMILRETMRLVGLGLLVGLPAVLAGSRFLESLLFNLHPYDPAVFGVAVTTLALVAALAGYLPARRAARLDPMTALRSD